MEPLLRVVGLPKGETNEKARNNSQHELGQNILGLPKILLEGTEADVVELARERHSKLAMAFSLSTILNVGTRSIKTIQFCNHAFVLLAVVPYLSPVL